MGVLMVVKQLNSDIIVAQKRWYFVHIFLRALSHWVTCWQRWCWLWNLDRDSKTQTTTSAWHGHSDCVEQIICSPIFGRSVFWSICFMEAVNGKVPFCYSWCCLGEKTWHVIDIGTLFFQENKCFGIEHGCTNCSRKWRGNGEERERDSLSTFPHFLYISSLSIHFFQHVIRAGWPKHVMQKIKLEIWGFVLPKRSEKIDEASWLSGYLSCIKNQHS